MRSFRKTLLASALACSWSFTGAVHPVAAQDAALTGVVQQESGSTLARVALEGAVTGTAGGATPLRVDADVIGPARSTNPLFRTSVDLVVLPVTVTDSHQQYVAGLTMADFQVYEDSTLQELVFFAADPVPLDLAILLDTSASMSGKIALAQEAAVGFARTLRAGDRAAVIAFHDAVQVRHSLSDDLASLESAIRETTAGGGTALYTALYVALKELASRNHKTAEVRRQAIVVLSDGQDTRSLVTSDDVFELVRRSGISIYTISLGSASSLKSGSAALQGRGSGSSWFESQSDYLMRTLAQETGGRAFFPPDIKELVPLYGVIAEELARQYTLAYKSTNPRLDGAFRRIAVRLPLQPGARPRTRLGYLAPRVSRATREAQ